MMVNHDGWWWQIMVGNDGLWWWMMVKNGYWWFMVPSTGIKHQSVDSGHTRVNHRFGWAGHGSMPRLWPTRRRREQPWSTIWRDIKKTLMWQPLWSYTKVCPALTVKRKSREQLSRQTDLASRWEAGRKKHLATEQESVSTRAGYGTKFNLAHATPQLQAFFAGVQSPAPQQCSDPG